MRIKTLRLIIVVCFILILVALIYLQLIRGDNYFKLSSINRVRVIPIDSPRGIISDQRGNVLADNRQAFHVAIIEQETFNKDELFAYLGKVLNKDQKLISKLYARRKYNPFAPVIVAEDISRDIVFKIEENRFLYPGLIIMQGTQRFYPYGPATAHVVGYIGKFEDGEYLDHSYGYTPLSSVGKNGIEKIYDDTLRGSPGGSQVEVNSRGQQVRILGIKEPKAGSRIVLTIDGDLSQAVMNLFNNRRGAAVFMDIENGDIPLLISSPSFNPNVFVDKANNEQVTGYFNAMDAPLFNRTTMGKFSPGSVFKIPVALAALQTNKINASRTFYCPGFLMVGQRRFGCAHIHNNQNLIEAVAHSCNVYFYHLGQILGYKTILAYARAFGLNRATGIDLPSESSGHLRDEKSKLSWFGGDVVNLSIGQGETLSTPLQITVLMGALATDGILIKPRLLKSIDDTIQPTPILSKRPRVKLRSEVWQAVTLGMRQVITDPQGTGQELNELKGVTIWGKTGTAQTGGLREDHAWFAGFVKGQSRTYAFCVLLEHGGSSAHAVTLSKEIILEMKKLNLF